MTKIACCQFAPRVGEVKSNVDKSVGLIHRAADAGAQVVVLPELASSGYAFHDSRETAAAAEPANGYALSSWTKTVEERNVIVVAGYCEENLEGMPFNSAALLEPGKAPVIYRKAHLWDAERHIFTSGESAPPVVETAVGRISVVICYDLEFPEWVRIPALDGADLICAPVNWPLQPRPEGERPAEVVRTQAQASMNRVAIAACDRNGVERGIQWTAASVIVDADGWPVDMADFSADEEEILIADIDLAESRNKTVSRFSNVVTDRRTDLYTDPNISAS